MKIFLSSTYEDLEDYRDTVESIVNIMGHLYKGMEYFGASASRSIDTCLRHVDDSDLVLCLIGTRYDTRLSNGESYTQAELEHADQKGIPIFPYFLDTERQPVLEKHIDTGEDRESLEDLKEWLKDEYTVEKFTTPDDLAIKVARDLGRVTREETESSDEGVHKTSFREIQTFLERKAGQTNDVVAVSAQNLDTIHSVDRVAADHEVEIQKTVESPGGSGSNTAYWLSKLGADVAVCGVVGSDENGKTLKQSLEKVDADTSCILEVEGSVTGTSQIFTDQEGKRSIYLRPGVNRSWSQVITSSHKESLEEKMRSAKVVHLSSFTTSEERKLQEELLNHCPEHTIVSFNPGALYSSLGLNRLETILERTNILFLYLNELDTLLGTIPNGRTEGELPEKIDRFYKWKKKKEFSQPLIVLVKSTEEDTASWVSEPEDLAVACGRYGLETYHVPEVDTLAAPRNFKDSTGIGDAISAGILAGLLDGMSIAECTDLAFQMGQAVAQEYGTRKGMSNLSSDSSVENLGISE